MPRKLRAPKARRGDALIVSRSMFLHLVFQDFASACAQADHDGTRKQDLYYTAAQETTYWAAIEEQALEVWTTYSPGSRPPLWWQLSAPTLRQLEGGLYTVISGCNRCHETGIAYITEWQDDPPQVESQAAFLDRVAMWLPGERARVPAEAFASQPFSWDLTVAPGVPDDVRVGDENEDDDDRTVGFTASSCSHQVRLR
jgi:hypothetical protein